MQRKGSPSCVIIPTTHRICSLLYALPKTHFCKRKRSPNYCACDKKETPTVLISPYFSFVSVVKRNLIIKLYCSEDKKIYFCVIPCVFLKSVFQPTTALNRNTVYDMYPTVTCFGYPQGLFQNKEIKFQQANLAIAHLSTISTDLHLYIFRNESFSTEISMLDWYSFVLEDSLCMAPRCRNSQKFDTCHKLYFIKFICLLIYC